MLGCALFLASRSGAADSRKAVFGALFCGVGGLASAQFGAPDMITVSAFGGLIISLAQVSKAAGRLGSHPLFVYLGEISCSIHVVCIGWGVLIVNLAANILRLAVEQLPLPLWLIFTTTLVPAAAVVHHLIERPARDGIKLWHAALQPHKVATVTAR